MKTKINEDAIILNDVNAHNIYIKNQLDGFLKKINFKLFFFIILIIADDIIILFKLSHKNECKKEQYIEIYKNINSENKNYNNPKKKKISNYFINNLKTSFVNERNRPYFKEINKRRTFENRFPLSKNINCKPHFYDNELIAFLSFLTKNTTFFETGSGCSSLIAKYYTKKSYAVEGCKEWYEKGIKNGLKDNLIFRDLKPDNTSWSIPGKNSNINDWKQYFQAYTKSYNANVILIDGRFKVATALDIFDKINDDTIIFLHEYPERLPYFIIENYYDYFYHWGRLVAFVKKKDIKSIPLEIQKQYWNDYL